MEFLFIQVARSCLYAPCSCEEHPEDCLHDQQQELFQTIDNESCNNASLYKKISIQASLFIRWVRDCCRSEQPSVTSGCFEGMLRSKLCARSLSPIPGSGKSAGLLTSILPCKCPCSCCPQPLTPASLCQLLSLTYWGWGWLWPAGANTHLSACTIGCQVIADMPYAMNVTVPGRHKRLVRSKITILCLSIVFSRAYSQENVHRN